MMEYRELGRSGIMVSRIGFGGAAIGGFDYGAVDDAESERALHAAVDSGITLFDVADVYGFGHAERVLARALGGKRRDIVIATKVGVRWDSSGRTWRDLSPGYVRSAVQGSLERLGTTYIDLVQLHWPSPTEAPADAVRTLQDLKDAGDIRAAGCCNFSSSLVNQAQSGGRVDSLQLPFNLAQGEGEDVIAQARSDHGMGILVYNALAQGLFTGKYNQTSSFAGTDLRQRSALFTGDALDRNLRLLEVIRDVGRRNGRSPAQVAVRWLLDRADIDCVLVGARNPDQVRENAGSADWQLPADDHAALTDAARIP